MAMENLFDAFDENCRHLYEAGVAAYENQDWKTSTQSFDDAIKLLKALEKEDYIAPAMAKILCKRAEAHIMMNSKDLALLDTAEALELQPSSCEPLMVRAKALESVEKYYEALEELLKAHRIAPDNANINDYIQKIQKLHGQQLDAANETESPEGCYVKMLDPDLTIEERVRSIAKLTKVAYTTRDLRFLSKVLDGAIDLLKCTVSLRLSLQVWKLLECYSLRSQRKTPGSKDIFPDEENPQEQNFRVKLEKEFSGRFLEEEEAFFHFMVGELRRTIKNPPSKHDIAAADADYELLDTMLSLQIRVLIRFWNVGDVEFLEVLNDFVKQENFPLSKSAAITCFCAKLSDYRKSKRKSLEAQQLLLKFLENLMICFSANLCKKVDFFGVITNIFSLFNDPLRPPSNVEVDMLAISKALFLDYIRSDDEAEKKAGIIALHAFLTAKSKEGSLFIIESSLLERLVEIVGELPGSSNETKNSALQCLGVCFFERDAREAFLQMGLYPLLLDMAPRYENSMVGAQIAGVLARLCTHNEETRIALFANQDFIQVCWKALNLISINSLSKDKGTVITEYEDLNAIMDLFFVLSPHAAFKKGLIKSEFSSLLDSLCQQGKEFTENSAKCNDLRILYCYIRTICSLMCSNETKLISKKDEISSKSGMKLDEGQQEQLHKLYEMLPKESRPKQNMEVDLGEEKMVESIREYLLKGNVISHLRKILQIYEAHGISESIMSIMAQIIGFLCKEVKNRPKVVQQGGLKCLCNIVERLKDDVEIREIASQALARMFITINPSYFSYENRMDSIRPLLDLSGSHYELYQYEAALALVNLASFHDNDEIQMRIYASGRGWSAIRELAFSSNDLVSAAGLEIMCNLAQSMKVTEKLYEKWSHTPTEDIRLILAFVMKEECMRARLAAAGCLAGLVTLTLFPKLIISANNFENIYSALKETSDNALLTRILCVITYMLQGEDLSNEHIERMYAEALAKKADIPVKSEAHGIYESLSEAYRAAKRVKNRS